MTIAIHQPNFFPHYPFFQKMEQAELFVLMGACQFEKGGYQNRFKIQDKWYTMSVLSGLEPIVSKQYINPLRDIHKIAESLPEYAEIIGNHFGMSWVQNSGSAQLYFLNKGIITSIAKALKIKTPVVPDYQTALTGTARLVHICQNYGATKYLSGPSGKNYLDLSLFEKAGIEVIFQEPQPSIPIIQILHDRGM